MYSNFDRKISFLSINRVPLKLKPSPWGFGVLGFWGFDESVLRIRSRFEQKFFFDLTFTDFHMGRKKGPKSISNDKNHQNLFDYLLINVRHCVAHFLITSISENTLVFLCCIACESQ